MCQLYLNNYIFYVRMFIVRRTPRIIVSHTKYVSQFHTTGSALNIMDWFRSNKKKKQLMETVASATKEGAVASKDKLELIPENFIGRKKNRKRIAYNIFYDKIINSLVIVR